MRVLGDVDASPELDLASHDAEPGEKWLLCSDGLNAVVPDRVVESVVRNAPTLQDAVDQLVELTLDGGSPDNVTIVMIEVVEAPPAAADTASLNLPAERPLESGAADDGGASPAAGAPAAAAGTSPDGAPAILAGIEAPENSLNPMRQSAPTPFGASWERDRTCWWVQRPWPRRPDKSRSSPPTPTSGAPRRC